MRRSGLRKRQRKMEADESESKIRKGSVPEKNDDSTTTSTEAPTETGLQASSGSSDSGAAQQSCAEVLDGGATPHQTPVECSQEENLCESSITDSSGQMTENSAEKRSLTKQSPEGDLSRSYKEEGVGENREEEPSREESSQEKTEASSKRKKSAEEGLSASKIAKVSDADAGTSGEHSEDFKKWFEELGLMQYYNKFIEEGFDDLEVVAVITECDLEELGVRRGHRRKILNRFSSQRRSLQQEDAKLEVKQWIDSAGCIQYYDTFIDEGFDDMESLSLIKEEDLTAMKLKLGFKRKILSKLNPAAPASSPASESENTGPSVFSASSSFKGQKEGELSFSKGTSVTILKEYSEGICKGMADGKEGLFPKAALFQSDAREYLTDREEPLRSKQSLQTPLSESSVEKLNVNAPTPDVQRSRSDGDVADKNSASDTPPPVQSTKTLKELAAEEDGNKVGDVVSSGIGPPKSNADDGRNSDGSGLERQCLQENAAGKERGSQAHAFQIRRPPKDQYLSDGTPVDAPGDSPVDAPQSPVHRRIEPQKQPEGTHSEEAEVRTGSANPAQKELSKGDTSAEKTSLSKEKDLDSSNDEDSGEEFQNAFEDPSVGNEADLRIKQSAPGVVVTFNALLHPEWNLKKGQEVFIRFGIAELGNWEWNTITMTITREITAENVTLLQLSGNFVLPTMHTHQAIPYKYAIGRKKGKKKNNGPNPEGEVEYEFLKKGRHGGIVNRILLLPNSFRGCDKGYYVKYDDLIRRAPGTGGKIWQAIVGSNSRHVDSREVAIRQLLPKWTGFYCADVSDIKLITMLADEALTDLSEVVHQLKFPLVQENVEGSQPFPWHLDGLDVSKILASVLKPKIQELGKAKPSDARKALERLVSAIAIAIVVKIFKLNVLSRGLDLQDFHVLSSAFSLPADFDNRTCECLKVVKQNFPYIRSVLDAICNVCDKVTDTSQPSHHWAFAVPLYHFLDDLAKPFVRTQQLDWKKDEWWGLGLLSDSIRRYKPRADKLRLLVAKEALMPLFLLDPLLLHVVMFTSRFEDLKLWNECSEFGYETIIAILKKIEKQVIDVNSDSSASLFRSVIDPVIFRLQRTTEESVSKDLYFTSTGLQASVELLHKMCHRLLKGKKDIIRRGVDLIFSHLNVLERTEATEHPAAQDSVTRSKSSAVSREETLRGAAGEVVSWLLRHHSSSYSADALRRDIQVWSDMLIADLLTPDMAKCWGNFLSHKLKEKLKNINSRILLQAFSLLQDAKVHSVVTECFFQVSEAALRNTARSDPQAAFRSLSATARSNFGAASTHSIGLLRELLFWNLPAAEAPNRTWLSSLVSWPLWGHYLRCSAEFFPESTSDVRQNLDRAKNVVSNFAAGVLDAQVSVADFNLIRKNQDCFLSLCQLLDEKEQAASSFKNKVAVALTQREEELQHFTEERKLVLNFVNVCLALGKIALGDIRDHSSKDVSDRPISSLARRSDDGSIAVVYFALPQEVGQYIKPLNRLQPSLIFQQLWRDRGDQVNEERGKDDAAAALPMNLDELVQQVIEPVFTVWEMMCGRVKKGDISLHEVKTLFGRFSGDRKKLETELRLMERSINTKWVTERVDQICLYNTLSKAVNAARAVIRVCDELNVSNSFPAVVEIASQDSDEDFHQRPLSSMTREVVSAGQFLADMTTKQIQCLHQFAECGPLIKWVREEIKEWKELETFVELAGTRSSAEGDFEAFKVAHLRAACAGFSPLLFDFKEDVDLNQFLKACKSVFDKLAGDQQIPQKWRDTQKYLRDFKIMKESLGSVEVSSFSQVEIINSRGQYTVGGTSGDVKNCISLKIKPLPNEESGGRKTFSLGDLQDLQSKLILISGHGSERQSEVNVFVNTLDKITRLALNLVALCRAGHVKYLAWTKVFDCVSPLKQSEEKNDLNASAALERLLKEMSAFEEEMNSDLKEWKEKMSVVRSDFYYLNYYTTSQLLLLEKNLGRLALDREIELPNFVYGLLECIKPNINANDVSVAMGRACSRPSRRQAPRAAGIDRSLFGGGGGSVSTDLFGFGREFPAGEGLGLGGGSLGFQDFGLQQRNVLDFGFGSAGPTDMEGSGGWSVPTQSVPEADRDIPVFNMDNPEYLSLETLGEFLQNLSQNAPLPPSRSFPTDQLEIGYPNLIVVPQAELIPAVLRLYMSDRRLPLPSAEEVLLCSSATTFEAVSLFWRRAIKDPSQSRVFCLAGADRLSYEVSREAVDELYKLSQGLSGQRGESYRLVVICSAENEDKSYMISALDQQRKLPLPCPSPQEVQSYLKSQFQSGPAGLKLRTVMGTMWTPAAQELDHEQCCVRVVYSTRAGVGKSLFIGRMSEKLVDIPNNKQARSFVARGGDPLTKVIIPLQELSVDSDDILETLEPAFPHPEQALSRLIHLDVSPSVRNGLEEFLFNLLVLGQITDSRGRIWRRRLTDMYVLECTWSEDHNTVIKKALTKEGQRHIPFEYFLPAIPRGSPKEALELLQQRKNPTIEDPSLDGREFGNSNFQRAFQYLVRFINGENLDPFKFRPGTTEGTPPVCLETLLTHCGVPSPSWAILRHFINFLSNQLRDCEQSDFCNPDAYGDDLPGFKNFVMKLVIRMSRDFSTPSLSADLTRMEAAGNLQQYQLRRRWEHSPHPYLFFNEDRHAMTPIGLQITRDGNLINPLTAAVLDEQIMSRDLSTALYTQGFRLQENYEEWPKERKIAALCNVMGLPCQGDPDPSYELTSDNVIKILAIHMRFRCGIPVVVMGETGCGKTRLIRYMCSLQAQSTGAQNMFLMKVHGGINRNDIIRTVRMAEFRAEANAQIGVKTVLFFDEANTTDAVGLIKEIMCDRHVNGHPIRGLGSDLHVIAACNPYRKHTDEMIKKLESAGLGYHVRTGDTEDRLGDIPLRQLVYRVHPLPESMKALVWDFGQLNPVAERLYIRQIVSRHVNSGSLPNAPGLIDVATAVLAASQSYMRDREDECSFVSLRDVERAMMVMVWFYKLNEVLDPFMRRKYDERKAKSGAVAPLDPLTRSLVLALGVSYQARLQERKQFRSAVSRHFRAPCALPGAAQMRQEIDFCQAVFLDELELPPKIGRNHALKENVFMMVVCIDLRIPLFLVGKPGSSKSLAKDVVKNAMRGDLSNSELYKKLKQAHMVSYQCSPLSTADGIISTFSQCQRMQKENDLERFVACVVLDEVGLAEDSPRLPLKALHPLLDDGTAGADNDGEEGKASNRVAFVGISNWALDPAKMNRGILVQREVPTDAELVVSARGICSTDEATQFLLEPFIPGMAKAYLEIYNSRDREREFFGLRDFYSLVKMIFSFCKITESPPRSGQLLHAIRRNFGGLDSKVNPETIFFNHLQVDSNSAADKLKLDSSPAGLIRANLSKAGQQDSEESRYLLLLTENYAALTIVRQRFLVGDEDPVIIFGSSFSKDQEYTQICRNINRVKVCMATGRTVVLLNLDKLYESLYDALNQYYVYHGGQRFVDLGLGSHRVKCQVHRKFRLILIADREAVYKDFPIPLINRMEKHFLAMSSILTHQQQRIVEAIDQWVKDFSEVEQFGFREERKRVPFRPGDAFVGYHPDAAATIVLRVCRRLAEQQRERNEMYLGKDDDLDDTLLNESLRTLMECAAPDAVARLQVSRLRNEASDWWDIYFKEQSHSSLADYLCYQLERERGSQLIQVTTHSRLLSNENVLEVEMCIKLSTTCISLQQFDTEEQFCSRVSAFYSQANDLNGVLLVLCESGDVNGELVACARYLVQECRENAFSKREEDGLKPVARHIVFIIHLPRVAGGCFVGFQGGAWSEVHIDDLRPAHQAKQLSITSLVGRKLSTLLGDVETGPQLVRHETSNVEMTDIDQETSALSVEDMEVEEAAAPSPRARLPANEESILSAAVLFRSCVHAATSRLDDPAGSALEAANMRLTLLLRLIPEDETSLTGVRGFYVELKRRVIKLLIEREERAGEENAREWVKNEALSQNSIQAGGTFRHSLWLKIVNVVTPILAELIAFVDVDSNLLLLQETAHGVSHWIGELWLKLFASFQLTPLRYEEFLSPTQQEPRHRVLVKGSGHHDHVFQANFPFSRLIKDEVDGMIEEARLLADRERGRLADALQRLFDGSSMAKILRSVSVKSEEEMAKLYLHDFVHMVHNPKGAEDFELVFNAILSGFNEMTQTSTEQDVLTMEDAPPVRLLTIPTIHAAYEAVKLRLNRYSELTVLDKTVFPAVYEQLGSRAGDEMTLDTVAFTIFLENLQPKPNELSFEKSRLAWLHRVQEARPCVEAWLALPVEGFSMRTALCGEARSIWTKISAVRLYFEHTKVIGRSSFAVGAGENLWKCFETHNPNFGTLETMQLILRFLNETGQDCSGKLFGPNGVECVVCENMWKEPVELPCRHIFCLQCTRDWITEERRTCPTCRDVVPQQFDFRPSEKLNQKTSGFVKFKSCCTAFFMELVAVYSFNEHARTPPQRDLVQLLMHLITRKRTGEAATTRAFSPFTSDAIDATPTVRSFLLQLLLRYTTQEAMNYVQEYFEHTRRAVMEHTHGVVSQRSEEELAVIFVQCFEDSITRTATQAQGAVFVDRLHFAVQNLRADQHSVPYLQAVASARFGLCVIADVILHLVDTAEQSSHAAAAGLDCARQLCAPPYDPQILLFLLKQLVKRRGADVLRKLQNVYELRWLDELVLQHTRNDEEVIPDYLVVIGDTYKGVREGVARAILTESRDPINAAANTLACENVKENCRAALLLLALYREVTMRRAYADRKRHVTGKMQDLLQDYCRTSPNFPPWAREIGYQLFTNSLANCNLPVLVAPGQSMQTRAAAAVAFHVRLAIEAAAEDPLLRPFRYMMKDPARLARSYMPTMPEDNFAAVRGTARGDVGTTWHECPNGHPYFIDNCGGAVTVGKCFCGAAIGGLNYQLQNQNVKRLRENDITETGHILGQADARSDNVAPERGLSSACCALIRVLMHASLMWGSCDMQLSHAIAQIVKPGVAVDQLPQFFWNHFEKDVGAFAKAIGNTPDDASVVLHWFLNTLVSQERHAAVVGDGTLSSKEERQGWEADFARRCIEPTLQETGRSFRGWLNSVVNDERVGNNPLMRWLYEIEAPPGAQSPASLWRYRAQVTVEHLTTTLDRQFEGKPVDKKPRILREFLREERNLRFLQFLPQILQLQRMLLEKFHRRLALHEAATFSVTDFLRSLQDRERQEYAPLIGVFQRVWAHLGHEILTHGRLKPKNEEEKLGQVTATTPIAFLLPTTTGKGRCAMSLVDYLINCVHNEFVPRFRNLVGLEGEIPIIPMSEITRAQLISYDFERDFFPLVLAHCNYSLEVGKGSDVTYDFAALERQLIDRFLTGKPHVLFKPHQFIFSQHAEALFGRIEQKIPQEKLSIAVSRQIINEVRDLTQVYGVLSVLDVLIGFIGSTGGDGECLVHDYLHKTLKMPEERGLVSAKARQYCRLKHTLSLWRLLMVEKGKRLVLSHRDPFEDFPDAYKEDMDLDLKRRLVDSLRRIDLDSFMNDLVQLAWLEVKNKIETQGLEEYSLCDALEEWCYSKLKGLRDIPDDVQLRHLMQCWSAAVELQASLERQ
ncbi:E3 ubiquitin-protein ligase RNF213-like isoform X3 [Oscarella lobularis]|uniref:E3 ubiquitin-protein ligase RNF213-like isoform X3 n=1 Tax=Oscarella lobularis TaxID=121494 RepID=UPI0033144A53